MKTSILLVFSLLFVVSLQNAYDENLSDTLWKASSAAYQNKHSLQNMECGQACEGMKGYKFDHQFTSKVSAGESVSYSVFVNPKDNKVVFAFRGTDGNKQLLKEALQGSATTYKLHDVPNAVATGYFYNHYKDNLRKDFMDQVKKMEKEHPKSDFYFTGHSLGGALTTLGALDASMSGTIPKNKVHLYTYGSPRVGDVNLAEAVNKHVNSNYRVTHGHDIVPHVPPCITDFHGGCTAWKNHWNENGLPIWNAYHTGTEVFYNDDKHPKKYQICSKPEDPKCAKQYNAFSLNTNDHGTYLGHSTETHFHKHLPHIPHPSHTNHPIHYDPNHPQSLNSLLHNITHNTHKIVHDLVHNSPYSPYYHHNQHHNSTHHPSHSLHHNPTHGHNSTHNPSHSNHHTPTHGHNSTHNPSHSTHHTPIHSHPSHSTHHTPIHGHNSTHNPSHSTHHTPTHGHDLTHNPSHSTHHTPTHGNEASHHSVNHHPTQTPHSSAPVHHQPQNHNSAVHHQPQQHHNPAPVHHQPQQHHNPVPVHHQPQQHHNSAPVHHQPQQHHNSAPVHHQPQQHHNPAPVHHQPQHHNPAPVHHKPAPAVHHPAPVHHNPAPAVHHPTPVHHNPAPVAHHPTNLRPIKH